MALTPVQKELRKIAADFRRYQILRGLAASWAAVAAIGGILLVAYRASGLYFPNSVAALFGLSVVAGFVVIWRNNRTDVALREIARLIERDDPKLNTLLLAAAEQQPDPKTGELNFLQVRVIQEAIEANRRAPWNERFAQRLRTAQLAHLALLIVLSCVLVASAFMVPHPTSPLRAFGSGLEITPGNANVEKGSTLAVLAKFSGKAPGDVFLVYQSVSGEEQKLPMARSLSDPLFGVTLPELQEKTTYRVEYGDKNSEQFTVNVFEYPDLKRADAELKFPEYTGFQPAKIEDTRRVSAVEGTAVHYSFFLNKAVRTARLIGTNDMQIVLTNNPANPVAYSSDFALMESGNYRLELVDDDGRTNKLKPEFTFVALENQRPKLKLKSPRGDQRVSALEEVAFNGQVEDDFGVASYGLAYRMAGEQTKLLNLSPQDKTAVSKPHESKDFSWMLALEKLSAEPGQLVSYYLWAEDLGPDGKPRKTESDMFFAEVRPFEEIFRAGDSSSGQQEQQQQGQNQNPATKLLELEKQIITATWNLQRRETGKKATPNFKADVAVVKESQEKANKQAEELKDRLRDEKSHAIIENAITAMDSAAKNLADAASKNSVQTLPPALEFEQTAYQALLKLQAREYQVSRSRSSGGQQQNGGEQRAQRQLDQLELKDEQNRYETQSQASPLQNAEQREALQVLNRLKELARRQQDMSERLKELQSALNEAKTPEEKEKLERMLKRLQEEQQQIVQDTDELRQRMSQAENQSRMAEARDQLDKSREQSRAASQELEQRNVGKALSSSSRAEQSLQELSDKFRKSTSSQFSDQMRNLRQQTRELTQKQEELQKKLQETSETRQRTLSDEGPKKEIAEGLAQQRSALTNVMQNMRQVTEQAEAAEPLLSRQLYETWRKASQADPEKNLQIASQALDRNLLPMAREAQRRNEQPIKNLAQGVEQAARSVLGDEAESLKFAEKELQDLAERVEREMNRALGRNSTNDSSKGVAGRRGPGTNSLASAFQQGATNNAAGGRSGERGNEEGSQEAPEGQRQLASNNASEQRQGEGSPSESNREGSQGSNRSRGNRGNRDAQQAQNGQRGENGENAQGQEQGETNQQGEGQQASAQNQEGQQGQPGQPGERGQGQGGRQQGRAQQGEGARQQAQAGGDQRQGGGQPQGGRRPGGQQRFFEQWARGTEGGDGNSSGDYQDGPLTGRDFTGWSDRLRDLEEVLQDPALRNEVARARDRARGIRMEYKRHATLPQWDLVQDDVVNPLRIVQRRVAEELARTGSREAVVPVDRDPVPPKYSDLVSRYYERLGKD